MGTNGTPGKTPHSFRKHELLLQVIRSQCHAQAVRIGKSGPMLLVDLTAGDGNGVPLPQLDLFLGMQPSRSSPEILYTVGREFPDTQLVLCETLRKHRIQLAETFPSAQILGNSNLVPTLMSKRYAYALIVSDPNGMGHDLSAMQAIAIHVPRSDFVLTINEAAFRRVLGGLEDWADHQAQIVRRAWGAQQKAWMLDPDAWRVHLKKRRVAVLRQVIKASKLFHYRIVVVAHAMGDVIRRHPDQWEIFP